MSAHNATAFPPSSTSSKTPAETESVVYGRVLGSIFEYGDAFNKVAPQYRVLIGVPEPLSVPTPGSHLHHSPLIEPPAPRPDNTPLVLPSGNTVRDRVDWIEEGTSPEDKKARALMVWHQELHAHKPPRRGVYDACLPLLGAEVVDDDATTFPVGGTIDDVKDWVQESDEEPTRLHRASYAIFNESLHRHPRPTLMVWLERFIAGVDDN